MSSFLLDIKPHKVSRDLSGYITYIYGAPKSGKTTLAAQMDKSLILAFERGYNTLPGVMAVDVLNWAKMKEIFRELKKPEVKEQFNAVVVDTIDIASEACSKYICTQMGIATLGDAGFGKGWAMFKTEFNDMFRTLTMLGYAVFFIGHHKEVSQKDPITGQEYTVIRPSLSQSVQNAIEGLADVYGYAHQPSGRERDMSILTIRTGDDSIACGSRFKYIDNEIRPMSYDNLVNAIRNAIDKEAQEHDNQFVTDERLEVTKEANIEDIRTEFNAVVAEIKAKTSAEVFAKEVVPAIQAITEKYIGINKMANIGQGYIEQAAMILVETKDLSTKYQ